MISTERTPPHIYDPAFLGFLLIEGTRGINYGNCIAASRPDRITAGTHCIGGLNDKNGFYPTTQLLTTLLMFL
jgi:hypothetical protein